MEEMSRLEDNIRLAEAGTKGASVSQEWKGNIIICPGGGYQWHSPREAGPVAEAFAGAGWKPWILYYPVLDKEETGGEAPERAAEARAVQQKAGRIEAGGGGECLGIAPLLHAASAVKRVREDWPHKPVILCGFSAGGHVAASLGVHWNDSSLFSEEEQRCIRPDGLVLCYPVITSGLYAHQGSMKMLAGEEDSRRDYFSLERYVSSQTPPAFIWHTAADRDVPVQNTLLFAEGLAREGVPFELHIYPEGEHGLSLATKEVEEPAKGRFADVHVAGWFGQCAEWLDRQRKKEQGS